MYRDIVDQAGYRPSFDAEGDVEFKVEGRTYYILVSENDPDYVRLFLPGFTQIDGRQELPKAERLAVEVSADTYGAKVKVDGEGLVSVSVQLFVAPLEGYAAVFPRSVRAAQHAANRFMRQMKE
jgi:hypothetical protein